VKTLLVLSFCLLSVAVYPQTVRTFNGPDRAFQFTYPSILTRCPLGQGQWAKDCSSQGRLCGGAYGSTTIVCLAYPSDRLKGKLAFGGATFFVAKVAVSERACLAGEDWLVEKVEGIRINGARFQLFHTSDAWLGGGEAARIYRVFRDGTCYELGLQEGYASTGGYDPGSFLEYTTQDQRRVRSSLEQALTSFRFLK